MGGPIFHITFDPIGAIIIGGGLLAFIVALTVTTSWYWKRRFTRSPLEHLPLELQLERLLNSLPDGVLLADRTGRVLWGNAEARRLLSLNDDAPRLDGEIAAVIERVAASQQVGLYEQPSTDGVRLQIKAIPLTGTNSTSNEVVGLITDVSQQRQQEAFYRSFISNISHELLTPLAAMAGHVANIRDAPVDDESRGVSLGIIEQEVERLTALTSNLLLLSRLETEKPLHLQPTNVGAIMEQAVIELPNKLEPQKQIDIIFQSEPGLPRLQADRDRLKQVFVNLIGNAIKHCPAGSEVQVCLSAKGDSLVAEVKDNGPGIPPEDLPHIFEKLYRVQKEASRAKEGSGLGLSIARQIVELHGGEITAESTIGEGTTFRFRLPLGQDNQP